MAIAIALWGGARRNDPLSTASKEEETVATRRSDGVGAEKDDIGQDNRDRKWGDCRPYEKESGSTNVILTAIMCTAATVRVLSSMDALGLVGGVDDDYKDNNGASPAGGGAECVEANGPSIDRRWRHG